MQTNLFILQFCFSLLFVASPILALNAELKNTVYEEMTCCTVSDDGKMMCCDADDENKEPTHTKKSCQETCHDHAANVLTLNIQSPNRYNETSEFTPIHSLKIPSYFQDLTQQQFILQFWNPPKHV